MEASRKRVKDRETWMPSLLEELGSKVGLENSDSLTGSISAEAGVSTASP